MASRYIGPDFQRDVELDDGTKVRLRLIRPSDRERLVDGLRKLSPQSRYMRFLSATTELSSEALRYLTELDHENHLAIVAGTATEHEGDEEGIGIARFVRSKEDPRTAECAVTVSDKFQGRGIGRLLLAAVTLAARERGVERFTAEVLKGNTPVLSLLANIGARCHERDVGDVVLVDLPLPELPVDGDFHKLPDGAGAQLLRFAADELHLLHHGEPKR